MEDCWNLNNERRPTFEEIAGRMRDLLKTQEVSNSILNSTQYCMWYAGTLLSNGFHPLMLKHDCE